jgi:hypothetical protein
MCKTTITAGTAAEYAHLGDAEKQQRYGHFFRTLQDIALPNMVLQQACRRADIKVTYTVIESLTADGRDRCLRDLVRRAAGMVAALQSRLLPPAHHPGSVGRDCECDRQPMSAKQRRGFPKRDRSSSAGHLAAEPQRAVEIIDQIGRIFDAH